MCSWNGVHRRNLRGLAWRASCGQARPERGDITTAFSQLAYIWTQMIYRRIPYMCTTNSTTNDTFFTLSGIFDNSCLFACLFCLFSVHNLYNLIVYNSKFLFLNLIGWAAFQELWYLKTHLTLCIPDRLSEGSLTLFLGHHYVRRCSDK